MWLVLSPNNKLVYVFNCWTKYLLCVNTFVVHMLSNEVMTSKDNSYSTDQHL